METRSQTREPRFIKNMGAPSPEGNRGTCELDVNIDFDLASKAWRANKKYLGDGSFKYVRNKYKENALLRAKLQGS